MKTDKELLELAAKAAGKKFNAWSEKITDYDSVHYGQPALHYSSIGGQVHSWNPLTDDGDALRLAVKLRITVEWAAWSDDLEEVRADDSIEPIDPLINEEYAATRRAIVRAAAAMGEAMQ